MLKKITVVIFCVLLFLPVLMFDFTENAVSEIDNRELAANPLTNDGEDFTVDVENYVNDRIGFRNEMIYGYTVLNDKLFGKMVHPSYTYGKDGYVFGQGVNVSTYYGEYHENFADMVKRIQDYCEARNVPFLFVFNPAKPAVLREYIAEGVNYNREWVDDFFKALDKRGVHYLDNTKTLLDAKRKGINVFNKKYDANHWNDLGAYYGTNAILQVLKKDLPNVHVNTPEDVLFTETKRESLLVSRFPINEMVPEAEIYPVTEDLGDKFVNELELDENYGAFGYFCNTERKEEGGPKALVFQGSYMNHYGYKFLQNAFGEYIYVHDYQNVLNFPYYYNIFKPECVIFEVAEYTFNDSYFFSDGMKNMNLQLPYQSFSPVDLESMKPEELGEVSIEEGKTLTRINWKTENIYDSIWLLLGDTDYDLIKADTGYTVTILTEMYNQYKAEMKLAAEKLN